MATYPPNISRLQFGGTLPRNDTWSMNVNLYDAGKDLGSGVGDMQGVFGNISNAIITWFTSGETQISSAARLYWVKLNQLNTAGKYKNNTTNEFFVGAGSGVAGPVSSKGWQHITMAITHRSTKSRGPANSGRVFPPAVMVAPDATGVASKDILTPMANVWASTLNAIYTAVPGELAGMPVIVSTGTKAAPNRGVFEPISRVEVGNVIDVQQRRRNALPETYIPATTAIAFQPPGSAIADLFPQIPGA